jgi:hypothetical protein
MPRRSRLDDSPLVIRTVGRPSAGALDLLAQHLRARLDAAPPPPDLKPVAANDESSGPVPSEQ